MIENKPTVSVCMITFNHEKYIEEAINSVLVQDCEFKVELIICNDCSTDNTDSIIVSIIQNHPKASWIKYIRHDNNMGMMANFSFALQQCEGKYIALCEGDDYWTNPFKLQMQVNYLEKNIEYSCHYFNCIYSSNSTSVFLTNQVFDFNRSIESGKFGPTLTFIFRRNILKAIDLKKYFEGNLIGDWPLELLALNFGKGYRDIQICGVYRVTDAGAISTLKNKYRNPKLLSRYLFFRNYIFYRNYCELGNKRLFMRKLIKVSYKNFNMNEKDNLRHLFSDLFLITKRFLYK